MKPAATTLSANLRPFKLFTARLAPSISSNSKKTSPTPAGSSNQLDPSPFGSGISTRVSLPNPAHSSCVSSRISRASTGSVSSSRVTMLVSRTHSVSVPGRLPGANPGVDPIGGTQAAPGIP